MEPNLRFVSYFYFFLPIFVFLSLDCASLLLPCIEEFLETPETKE
ncbi:hypothetical protein [Leptospira kanakyensis]|nr:hypothetical protein [Leptospira kanakyensis]